MDCSYDVGSILKKLVELIDIKQLSYEDASKPTPVLKWWWRGQNARAHMYECVYMYVCMGFHKVSVYCICSKALVDSTSAA